MLVQKHIKQAYYCPCPYPEQLEHARTNMMSAVVASIQKTAPKEWNARQHALCKRRQACRVLPVLKPTMDLRTEYKQRASERWPDVAWSVNDFGVKAGRRTNACFWLCLAAGWSQCAGKQYADNELQQLYLQAQSIDTTELVEERQHSTHSE